MVWKLIVVFVLAVIAGIAIGNADAATFRGKEPVCLNLAQAVAEGVQVRDSGVPWSVFEPYLNNLLQDALHNEETYVKDADDALFIHDSFKHAWDSPKLDAVQVAKDVFASCMRKVA